MIYNMYIHIDMYIYVYMYIYICKYLCVYILYICALNALKFAGDSGMDLAS